LEAASGRIRRGVAGFDGKSRHADDSIMVAQPSHRSLYGRE
jgi:hypothetical protein